MLAFIVLKIFQDSISLQILEEAPVAISICEGPELRFVFINQVGADAIRKTREEVLGVPYATVLPHARERVASLRKVYETGEKFAKSQMALPLGFDDVGNPMVEYLDFLSQPIKGSDGKVIGVASFGTLVTAAVEAKARLSVESHRTTAILNHLSTGFFSVDRHWNFTYANPASIPSIGLPLEEVIGKNLWEIHPHLRDTEFHSAYHRSMNERVVVDVRSYYPAQDKWYHTSSYPLDEGIAVSFTDITVRQKAEEARALSDERFHTLTEAMPQMVWITDSEGLATYFNSQWFLRTGTTFEQNSGAGWLKVIHPDDRETVEEAWKAAQSDGTYEVEYRVRMSDGLYRWHIARGVATLSDDRKIKQWFGTTTDIDGQKLIQGELEKAVKGRDEFLSIASHELKTPLTVMKLQTHLARRFLKDESGSLKNRIENVTSNIDHNIGRLTRLVDDMLDISRLEHGKFNLEFEKNNLKTILDDAVEQMSSFLKDSGCALEYVSGEDIILTVDKFRIEQVLINLLTNAVRYGKGKPVRVECQRLKDKVLITVRDQGPGIAEEDQLRIFNRYERAVNPNEVSGLGLGLFIVKNIIELHHGQITVKSELSRGTEFVIELPLT